MTRSHIGRLVFSAALWVVASCNYSSAAPQQSAQPEVKPVPQTPIAETKEELGKPAWDPVWDVIVEKELPPEFLSSRVARAVRPFCPRFNALSDADKRTYWAYFFQALAGAEAGLVPTTDVRHTEPEVAVEDTVTKRMVRSEGLLQLTYMDAERYGCDFDWQKDKELPEKDSAKTILLPENNLKCGVKILEKQLIERRKPLISSSSYWVTLRPGTISYQVFLKQMANVPEVCRVHHNRIKAKTASGTAQTVAGVPTTTGTN